MKKIIRGLSIYGYNEFPIDISIPEENLMFFEDFAHVIRDNNNIVVDNEGLWMLTSGEYESLRRNTRVVHIPFNSPFGGINSIPRIARNNIAFVFAAGNTYLTLDRRDLWSTEHPFWEGYKIQYYNNMISAFKTGKVIAATSAIETEEGDIVPSKAVVQCGDIAEWCFTVLPRGYTSGASARLAAMAFYLAQLYPTAEEIVDAMNVCAIDIGEPRDRQRVWERTCEYCLWSGF